MTKKHYEMIAAALNDARNGSPENDRAIDRAADNIAVRLSSANHLFDYQRFLKAAGFNSSKYPEASL